MITLRKSSIWVAVAVIGVTLVALAAVILAMAGAPRTAAPTPTALPGPAELSVVVHPTQAAPATPTAILVAVTPSALPSDTPTFPPPPTDLPTAAGITQTTAPVVTIVAVTQTGSGSSKSFDLPEGLYRVTFHADAGFDLVLPIVEQGDCGSEPLFDSGTGAYTGSATYESSGCRVHFEVDGAGGGWSLGVESISDAAPKSLPLTMKGSTPQTSDVVNLPKGQYLVAVENQGDSLVVTPLVLDGECLERPILVSTAPGSYQTTYESAGCRIIFQVSLTGGPWTLTVSAQP